MFKKLAAFITALVLLVCVFGAYGSRCVTPLAASISDLQQQLEEAKQDSNRLKAEIAQLEEKNAPYKQRLAAIRRQISATQREIDLINSQISAVEKQAAKQDEAIRKQRMELAKIKELFKKRLVAMYVSGSNSELLVLLSAEDFADYLAKSEFLRSVAKYDSDILDSVMDAIRDIEKKQAELEESKKLLEDSRATVAVKQAELDKQYADVNKIVAENQSEISDLEKNHYDYQQMIKDFEEAIRRAELEEAGAIGSGKFAWPVPGYYSLSEKFGPRICPFHGPENHSGIDISSSGIYGAKIVAADSGTVILSKYYGGYGNCVLVDHGNGYVTLYGHMAELSSLKVGAVVLKGDKVGRVGSTGNSTGPHLHFEIMQKGNPINPMQFF